MKTTRRYFVGLVAATAAATAVGQQKTPKWQKMGDANKMESQLKKFLEAQGVELSADGTLYKGLLPFKSKEAVFCIQYIDTTPDASTKNNTRNSKDEEGLYCISPEVSSNDILLGPESGFDFIVPDKFGCKPDTKLMEQCPEKEQETIKLLFEVAMENAYAFSCFSNCIPDNVTLSKGSEINGMITREPTFAYDKDIDTLIKMEGRTVSKEKRAIYGLLRYRTSSEWTTRLNQKGSSVGGCHDIVGLSGINWSIASYRVHERYSADMIRKQIWEYSQGIRVACIKETAEKIQEIIDGQQPSVGISSESGRNALKPLAAYCAQLAKDIWKLKANSAALKPKGAGNATKEGLRKL